MSWLGKLFAQTPSPSTLARRNSARLRLEALEDRLTPAPVLGSTGAAPLAAVVQVEVTYPDHQTAIGTGAMIDAAHALTAAHLLYSAKDGGYATSVEVLPDRGHAGASLGATFGAYERVDPSWIGFSASHPGATSPNVEDVGLVTLDRAVGNQTGWFNLAAAPAALGGTFQTAAFPAGASPFESSMQVANVKATGAASTGGISLSQHGHVVVPGESGSPLWQSAGKSGPVIYGVVTGSTGPSASDTGYAARLTDAVVREIKGWEAADHAPAGSTGKGPAALGHPSLPASAGGYAAQPTTPVIHAMDDYFSDSGFWDGIGQSSYYNDGYTYNIGEVNPYTGSSSYYTYDGTQAWSGYSYQSPYGGYSFSTPSWYQSMANSGYSRLGYVNPYSGDSYTQYYSYGAPNGYSWLYNYGY